MGLTASQDGARVTLNFSIAEIVGLLVEVIRGASSHFRVFALFRDIGRSSKRGDSRGYIILQYISFARGVKYIALTEKRSVSKAGLMLRGAFVDSGEMSSYLVIVELGCRRLVRLNQGKF